jgi:phage baseplate assembly protein W
VMRWEPRFRISSIRMQYEPPAGVSVEVSGRLGDDTLTTTARIGGGL